MAMKTPGVYIIEKNAFPNSVVEVATAVPAFIGYTEKAAIGGRSLTSQPTRISSMTQYVSYFGGPAAATFTVADVTTVTGGSGGTPPPAPPARGQSSTFTLNKKKYKVSRAALHAGGCFNMYRAMQHFFANGGASCYIVSVGDYSDDVKQGPMIAALEPLAKEQEPTMVLVPDAVLLDQSGCILVQQAVLAHCGGRMKNRVAVLDVWGGDRPDVDPSGDAFRCITEFRNDIGINYLNFGAAYYPWLKTSLVGPGDINQNVLGAATELKSLATLLKADLGLTDANKAANPRNEALWEALEDLGKPNKELFDKVKKGIDDSKITDEDKTKAKAALDAAAAGDVSQQEAYLDNHKQQLHKTLQAMSELYAQVLSEARDMLNLLPPSAAMAGLYTMVDSSRGVWKAPANISVSGIVGPSVEITHEEQEDLNVTTGGKSINAIRSFIGEGALVWGARTLDGNSLDWRYINVRRTMIMLEESCRLAAKAMVFEPNVANTWVTIKSMITNFLTGIWKRGGLAGAVPDDAFSVHVGLGDTMTPEDILEGILRVTVLVAITRPAEFIEITFQQQMQKS